MRGLRLEPASTDFVISIMTLITAKYGVFANPPAFIPPTGIKQGFNPNGGRDKRVHFSRNFIMSRAPTHFLFFLKFSPSSCNFKRSRTCFLGKGVLSLFRVILATIISNGRPFQLNDQCLSKPSEAQRGIEERENSAFVRTWLNSLSTCRESLWKRNLIVYSQYVGCWGPSGGPLVRKTLIIHRGRTENAFLEYYVYFREQRVVHSKKFSCASLMVKTSRFSPSGRNLKWKMSPLSRTNAILLFMASIP